MATWRTTVRLGISCDNRRPRISLQVQPGVVQRASNSKSYLQVMVYLPVYGSHG